MPGFGTRLALTRRKGPEASDCATKRWKAADQPQEDKIRPLGKQMRFATPSIASGNAARDRRERTPGTRSMSRRSGATTRLMPSTLEGAR